LPEGVLELDMTDAANADRRFHDEALPHMAAVHRFALRLTEEPDAAEDLVQETFLRAYLNWDKYVPGTQAKSWLFTICRNVFLRADRRAARQREIIASESGTSVDVMSGENTVFAAIGDRDPERRFWNQMVDAEIVSAIQALPEDYREVVNLADVEDLSYEEISAVLEVPIGTVKSRLFRGRRTLQRKLYSYAVESGIIAPPGVDTRHPKRGNQK